MAVYTLAVLASPYPRTACTVALHAGVLIGWYTHLTSDRLEASPEIKPIVSALTASAPNSLAKMRMLAEFLQRNIRYVTPGMPAYFGYFDHGVVAIKLPEGLSDSSLIATLKHPKLGTLLLFDPTNEKTPFGEIGGCLQVNNYPSAGTCRTS
ncbi:MAG TPA: hypothetical protein VEN79_04945 [Terriglobia bacterium]|nr:hypothetical protein [Terriglobia bacterium]